MNPVLNVGDIVTIDWPSETDEIIEYRCRVLDIERQKKEKKGSHFKYKLRTESGHEIETRLLHLKWELITAVKPHNEISKKQRRHRFTLPIHRFICAPMVGASELAFRLLCRRYGTQLAYTPMINSELFATDEAYRDQEFQTIPEDRPLVAHFSGNSPAVMVAAAKHVESRCDAIDLNLGTWLDNSDSKLFSLSSVLISYRLSPTGRICWVRK